MKDYDRVWADVDLDAVHFNMEQMHGNISCSAKMMGIIKTDAYGHGAVQIARELETLDYVFGMGLATAEEALILRHCGTGYGIRRIVGLCRNDSLYPPVLLLYFRVRHKLYKTSYLCDRKRSCRYRRTADV